MIASCLLYAPWLVILLRQFFVVSRSYWIGTFTLHTYLSFAAFPFYCSIHITASFLYIVLFSALLILICRKKAAAPGTVLFFLFPYLMVIVTGCAVSLLVRPLFSARYIKCILGLLIVCFSVIISDARQSSLKKILLLFCSVFAIANFFVIYHKNTVNNRTVSSYVDFLDSISETPVFAANQSVLPRSSSYFNRSCGRHRFFLGNQYGRF